MKIYEISLPNQPKFQIAAGFYQSAMQKSRRISRDLFQVNAFTAKLPIKIREIPAPTPGHLLTAEQMAYILGEPFLYSPATPAPTPAAHAPNWDRFCNYFNTIFSEVSAQ
jgi:hypothetical protein